MPWAIRACICAEWEWVGSGGRLYHSSRNALLYPTRKEALRKIRLYGWRHSRKPDAKIITAYAENVTQ